MQRFGKIWLVPVVLAAFLSAFSALPAQADEVRQIRLAQQFGIPFLPLTVIKERHLLEKAIAAEGLPPAELKWSQFANGTVMNESLISGNLDIASGGIGPMLTIWARTRGSLKAAGIASLGSTPVILNTINPAVHTLRDFTDKDKIAVPAVKVSIQAVVLQMAAEKEWGPGQHQRLDPLTVSMTHPDATIAMLSGRSEITAHFTNAPFQYQQLQDPRVHTVLNSYQVTGGPHTTYTVWGLNSFREANPKTYRAFLKALEEAMAFIRDEPRQAAQIYIDFEKSPLSLDFVEKVIRDPDNVFTTTPQNSLPIAQFMHRTGLLKEGPDSWVELFFSELHDRKGS